MFLTDFLDLPPLQSAFGRLVLPGSKSISNRVLLLSALSQGRTNLHDLLYSDDTHIMLNALRSLGVNVKENGSSVTIDGSNGKIPIASCQLFMGNAGTAIRPLTAVLSVLGGDFKLSGAPRMHERPIGDLVNALRQFGCNITYLEHEGYPPLFIGQPQLNFDEPINVRGDVSSQFLTALLISLPLVAHKPIVINVLGELISKPYIEITINLMSLFGIIVEREGWNTFTIPANCPYISPGDVHVEADASSASYFVALGSIASQNDQVIRIEGVGNKSIQGDILFLAAAEKMGANITSGPNWLEIKRGSWPLKAIELDCNHIPDAAMTLAVMALYAKGTTTLSNIASWRVKETDRLSAMTNELRKLGATVTEGSDFIQITPPLTLNHWRSASIKTYDDHRMGMCFSLAAFNPAKRLVRIENPACVAKTFPDYYEAFFSLATTSSTNIPVICIDGPTASGKGTLASTLAKQLGYHFLDSGALYRLTAHAALQAGFSLDIGHEDLIAHLAMNLDIQFKDDRVWLSQTDVSDEIRTELAGMNASKVSVLPQVRKALVSLQHSFQRLPGLVADGRDMGTVIFPDAALKVYLTANAAQRAQRRYKQLISMRISTTIEVLRADLEARDAKDSSRSLSPLKPAQDAKLLDNSNLTVEESLNCVMRWWQSKQGFEVNPKP